MLPFGAWAAFTAAALVLLFHGGSLLAAAGVFGFGATVILIGDNFIQPALVGGTTRLPFLLASAWTSRQWLHDTSYSRRRTRTPM
jgi:predicted PurR-regulated permease PerM